MLLTDFVFLLILFLLNDLMETFYELEIGKFGVTTEYIKLLVLLVLSSSLAYILYLRIYK